MEETIYPDCTAFQLKTNKQKATKRVQQPHDPVTFQTQETLGNSIDLNCIYLSSGNRIQLQKVASRELGKRQEWS